MGSVSRSRPNSRTSPTSSHGVHDREHEMSCDWILVGKGAAGKGFIHEDTAGRLIGLGEPPARPPRDAQGGEISG
jgi:hypothetical protein